MAARFEDPGIQARAFAPLALDVIVARGDLDPTWPAAFRRWYPAETDLRGHDARLGRLHAVAHGADLPGAFGSRPDVDPGTMLALAAERLVAPTGHVLDQQEDDRLAQGIARTLNRPEPTEAEALRRPDPVEAALAAWWAPGAHDGGAPLERPAHPADAVPPRRRRRTAPDRRPRPVRTRHAEPLKRHLAQVLPLVFQAA
ncbi:DUF2785 domain-containing protein [Streptomyces roseolus]|uniref:DUF2785 domain-containing protein n=1 Tax=Streptomyces roseolus TaxID=67358 RepID=UPI0033E4A048